MAIYDARSQPVNQVTIYEGKIMNDLQQYSKEPQLFHNSVPFPSLFHIGSVSDPPSNLVI